MKAKKKTSFLIHYDLESKINLLSDGVAGMLLKAAFMKDWRASVRTWSRSDRQQQPKSDATANICTHFSGDYSEKF
jgi:hypothetical protein